MQFNMERGEDEWICNPGARECNLSFHLSTQQATIDLLSHLSTHLELFNHLAFSSIPSASSVSSFLTRPQP